MVCFHINQAESLSGRDGSQTYQAYQPHPADPLAEVRQVLEELPLASEEPMMMITPQSKPPLGGLAYRADTWETK